MKNILITGGAGFIGSHLADRLVVEGYNVVVYDNLNTGSLKNLSQSFRKLKFIKGDVCDQTLLKKSLKGIDAIFHLAGLIGVQESFRRPLLYHRVNFEGSVNLTQVALINNVKKIIFSSACAVYGDAEGKVSETHPTRPLSPYAVSKLAVERYLRSIAKTQALEIIILRYFNVYGPRQNPNLQYSAVIPRFLKKAMVGKMIPIYGDGNQTRDFIYVSDVIEANMKALKFKVKRPSIFNIGSGYATSINQLLKTIEFVLGKRLKVDYIPPKKGEIYSSCASIDLARKHLNFTPKVSLDKGLKFLLNSFNDGV